jgi:hypothetical protein
MIAILYNMFRIRNIYCFAYSYNLTAQRGHVAFASLPHPVLFVKGLLHGQA